ncbi:MAG: band-7 C-terminal domain-containing protein, partial [Candidatus Cloacimonas sp.]
RAERDKRAKILQADGEREYQIRVADGEKQARIARAEGESQAKKLVAEGERQAIISIAEAVKNTGTDPAQFQIALRYIEAFREIVKQGDKTVVLPYESSALLGSVKTLGEIFQKV